MYIPECINCNHTSVQHGDRCTGTPITALQASIDGTCPCREFKINPRDRAQRFWDDWTLDQDLKKVV